MTCAVPYVEVDGISRSRTIVGLTMCRSRLVRTVRFGSQRYVGDPINAVRLFSEKRADEIFLLEIDRLNLDDARLSVLRDIASEALVPIAYGGSVRCLADARSVIRSGFEKVVVNTALHDRLELATEIASEFGSQALVGSIETKRGLLGKVRVVSDRGRRLTRHRPEDWARQLVDAGCGEILLTSIDRDGTMSGYDLDVVRIVASAVAVPVIPLGGAGSHSDFQAAIACGAEAVAAGSMFVFHGPQRAVLINYSREPKQREGAPP